jgi:hypothetical protein
MGQNCQNHAQNPKNSALMPSIMHGMPLDKAAEQSKNQKTT